MHYIMNNGALNDKEILADLRKLPQMYENGEIAEVQDICVDIANAIDDWSES